MASVHILFQTWQNPAARNKGVSPRTVERLRPSGDQTVERFCPPPPCLGGGWRWGSSEEAPDVFAFAALSRFDLHADVFARSPHGKAQRLCRDQSLFDW